MAEPARRDRLRVTVVSDARTVWGAERSVLALARPLAERGVHVTLACPPGEFARAGSALGLPHAPTVVPPRGGPRLRPVRELLHDARGLPAGVRRIAYATRGADVVHSNSLLLHPDAALAGRRSGVPTVVELHDIVTGPGAAALSAACALAAGVVAISNATADAVHGPARRRVTLVPQAVDTERFAPGPADPGVRAQLGGGPLLVAMIGRLDPSKGAHRLVRAAAVLPDVHVALVGAPSLDDGGYAARVARLGRELLGDRFVLAGRRDDVADVLRSCDVLANLSDAEPFGLSVLEAMACGRAIVATRTGGIPDFVADDATGLLVDPDDGAALVTALRALGDADLRARLGAAARAAALAHHTVDARADRFAALYRALAPHRAPVAIG